MMLRNYFKIALRNLFKQKGYAFINIFGLATGLACCILIILFIRHEWQHDRFHENADRLYQLVVTQKGANGNNHFAVMPANSAPLLTEAFSGIEHASGYIRTGIRFYDGDKSFRADVGEADNDFLKMFTFPILAGDVETALQGPEKIVLTRSFAQKVFGIGAGEEAQVLGKTLQTKRDSGAVFIVSAVVEDVPETSSMKFEVLISIEHSDKYGVSNNWVGPATMYVMLSKNQSPQDLEKAFPPFMKNLLGEKYAKNTRLSALGNFNDVVSLHLRPLPKVYMNDDTWTPYNAYGSKQAAYILATIAAFVLLIACINFTTLAVGRSSGRAMEVGMRKVLGAQRGQLIWQFWGESLMLCILALVAGLGLVYLFLPVFNELAQKELFLSFQKNWDLIGILFGVMLLTGIFAGSYPALVLSGFKPVAVFKGQAATGKRSKLTRALVVMQYTLSIFLIIATLVMTEQLSFMQSKKLGFNQEQVVLVYVPSQEYSERYKTRLANYESIISAGGSDRSFTSGSQTRSIQDDNQEWQTIRLIRIDPDYIPTLDIDLIAGRNFESSRVTDIREAIIINEKMAETMGWENPIGKQLNGLKSEEAKDFPTVIGMVRDYHIDKLDREIQPLVLHVNPDHHGIYSLFVRIKPGNITATIDLMKENWEAIAEGVPFRHSFLDENLKKQYREEARWQRIMGYAAIFAIAMSCLGLFGLAALAVTRRTKEIGIRKVLGASVPSLVSLLSKEFVLLLIIANVLAWLAAYLVLPQWLNEFAYRIELGIGVFLLSGIAAIIIALLTISFQSIRAALANPIQSLRYE